MNDIFFKTYNKYYWWNSESLIHQIWNVQEWQSLPPWFNLELVHETEQEKETNGIRNGKKK